MPKLSRNQKIILGASGIVVLILILIFLGIIPGLRSPTKNVKANLNFWVVSDKKSAYQSVIDQFQNLNPGIQMVFRSLDEENYEEELIQALAENKGPDIFMFHNTWLPKYYGLIFPLPQTKFNFADFQTGQLSFPQVVEQDFTSNETIYALPLSIDTLALIYNKDLFNQNGIALAPTTWNEFQNIIPKLRILDKNSQLLRAAAAIGGSNKSINRAADLLTLLMLQTGTEMTDTNFARATFAAGGLNALDFYTHFANPANYDYTWNDALRYSTSALADGSVAMIFDYASQIAEIKNKNPFLNLAAAPMPQKDPANAKNYADYYGYTVSAKSSYADLSWDFILLLATNKTNAQTYIKTVEKPPALNSLIQEYINDPDLSVFAKQALTAESWFQIDPNKVETIFSNMIESVISGRQTAAVALNQAEAQIAQLMKQ
jgi:ABC-type glycerol-3-phosphate transport system substrate-binding protein